MSPKWSPDARCRIAGKGVERRGCDDLEIPSIPVLERRCVFALCAAAAAFAPPLGCISADGDGDAEEMVAVL